MEERRKRFASDREQLEKEQGVRDPCLFLSLTAAYPAIVQSACVETSESNTKRKTGAKVARAC